MSQEEYFIKYFTQDQINYAVKSGHFVERNGRIFEAFGLF